MRISIVILIIILATSIASAQHLGNSMPVKSDGHVMNNPAADGREGGETIEDALPMGAIPWNDSGATCDNINDYDEVCPYSGSTSPDVVYSWTSAFTGGVDVDLFGSTYDTKVYVYDSGLALVACNDDFYSDYVSRIDNMAVINGETYFIVVDGYGGDCGEYVIAAGCIPPQCELTCPDGAQLEGEPPLVDGYVDEFNSGCDSELQVFQWLECADVCAVAGWYTTPDGMDFRDVDYFVCTAAENVVTWTVDAESATNCYELYIPDCMHAEVLQNMQVGACSPGTVIILAEPGTVLYLWGGSANFHNPGDVIGNEYDYIFTIEGIEEVSATEHQTWSGVKSLYR